MRDCRVQSARKRKGLTDFPCKSVGIVEYSKFARAVDPDLAVFGGSHDFPFGTVKLVPAIHGGMVEGEDAAAFTTVACGLVVTMGGVRIYHCGDTALTMEMQLLAGRVDVMLCPIGDNFTMGVDDAVRAVGFVKPRTVIPMHYGTFPVIAADPQAFVRGVGAAAQVVVLEPGQSWTA